MMRVNVKSVKTTTGVGRSECPLLDRKASSVLLNPVTNHGQLNATKAYAR